MFTTFLEKAGGIFGKGFLMTALLPSLAFWLLGLALYEQATGWQWVTIWWPGQPADVKLLVVIGLLLGLILSSLTLSGLQLAILRAYEGYWAGTFSWPVAGSLIHRLHDALLERQCQARDNLQKRMDELAGQIATLEKGDQANDATRRQAIPLRRELAEVEWAAIQGYPAEDEQLRPTALGNVLRVTEYYPRHRYGMDAVILWPRLVTVLPKEFVEATGEARLSLDALVTTSFCSLLFALVWGVVLLVLQAWGWAVVAILGGLIVAFLAYRIALPVAWSYGEMVKAAYDTHRWKLLDLLRLEPPADPEAEKQLWTKVSAFLYRGTPLDRVTYQQPDSQPKT